MPEDQPVRIERFEHGGVAVELLLPPSSEDLIDEDDFERDERLPYWAELWPSAQALTRFLLEESELPDRVLELGAGIGLPSLALSGRGIAVLATDYYDEALRFARANAAHNRLPPLETLHLDWRDPPESVGRFPLVIAADVLYEERNAEILAALVPRVVEAGGSFLLADPGRVHLPAFLARLSGAGWSCETLPQRTEPSPAGKGLQVGVRLFRVRPP